MKNYKGVFDNWQFGHYTADSPDGKYRLWTANGFPFFADYRAEAPLITGASLFLRYRLWRELKRARKRAIEQKFVPLAALAAANREAL